MGEMIDRIAAEAERIEESGVVRRRGRFCHEAIEGLAEHTFRGRDPGEHHRGHEEHGGSQSFHSFDCAQDRHVARNATRMGHREISERPETGKSELGGGGFSSVVAKKAKINFEILLDEYG
jgi:hypothetical protein